MNIELYIEKKLCDIENPDKFSIFLKRQFINPAELNFKDAQKSYSISLPATANNNSIFGFANTEEVAGKFVKIYDALLIVDGIKILDGKFRLSEIGKNYYSGNLGIPAPKTVKDIFGDKNMNETGEWLLDFTDFSSDVANINNDEGTPDCIFPYVMYGLLPKKANIDTNEYTGKRLWDDNVVLGMDDLPPSLNCLEALKHIFEGEGLRLSGTAFNDERLTKLYMSYKNPSDYQMPWNYGTFGKVKLNVEWANYRPKKLPPESIYPFFIEPTIVKNTDPKFGNKVKGVYIADLLSAINSKVTITDPGGNVRNDKIKKKIKNDNGSLYDEIYSNRHIVVPCSGLYKITFNGTLEFNTEDREDEAKTYTDLDTGLKVRVYSPMKPLGPVPVTYYLDQTFEKARYEVKLIRDWGRGSFNLKALDIDRDFFKNNINQTTGKTEDDYPKYFPKAGEMCFIDPAQNPDVLCGVSFGKCYDLYNPAVVGKDKTLEYCNPIAIKGGMSWNHKIEDLEVAATACNGYWKCELDENNKEVFKEDNERFTVNFTGLPYPHKSYAHASPFSEDSDKLMSGNGSLKQVVWLEKGERLTVVASCDEVSAGIFGAQKSIVAQDIGVYLKIEAFRTDEGWVLDRINPDGSTKSDLDFDWNDNTNFDTEQLNLAGFLPSDVKVDAWIDNFCKAFNLNLIQTDENEFELNVKKAKKSYGRNIIDLDAKANVDKARKNTPLNLPSVYQLGFSVDKEERGYKLHEEDGGGVFETGNTEGTVLNQTTTFSYNWFEDITFSDDGKTYKLPLISKNEPWKSNTVRDYARMMDKYYPDLAQRFWYRAGTKNVSGFVNGEVTTALVKNELEDKMSLDYYKQSKSILDCYFTTFVNNRTNYTMVDCHLTPAEYERLPYSPVRFNGDLYYAAEIDGYDPLGRRMCTLKLLRHLL